MLALFLLAWVARAEGPSEWVELYDARLREAAYGDTEMTVALLEPLLARLEPDNPLRGEVAYYLANARLAMGDFQGARQALSVAAAFAATREAAIGLLSQIDALERQVGALPMRSTFDTSPAPFAHSWQHGSHGTLDVAEPEASPTPVLPGDLALRWSTRVRDTEDDQLVVTFTDAVPVVHGVRFRAFAEGFPAYIRLIVEERDGHEFASDYITLSSESWFQVDALLKSFFVAEPGTPRSIPDPTAIRSIRVQDVTSYMSADRGPLTLWIDDLEIW